ncbi:hypothetical protein D9758_004728 [Tetrapyrgos nigripes]|uniref:Cytochrome P450 n=1 Tax=Tetrapyrgos nigripes TaxID=182062 RepID=A0A8H5GZL4_9AGAR|nr:hypothetical protein D9758_004728 [Tetrapyrgos nigripes]
MSELKSFLYLAATFGAAIIISKVIRAQLTTWKLRHVPTVGPKGFFSSYYGGVHFIKHAYEMAQEGYNKYQGRAFKVRMPDQWLVVITGPDMINDFRKAGDDYLSFDDAIATTIQTDYTIGKETRLNNYHLGVVRTSLTRNISHRFGDVRDEIVNAFSEEIPIKNDWVTVPALSTVMRIVCRTTNRLFVDLPLCRESDYMRLNIEFTVDVFKAARIINLFPDLLKPIAGNLLTPISKAVRQARRHLEPMIQERLDQDDQYGKNWAGRPNDLLSWLLDENPQGDLRTVRDLTLRILNINMAAIHTTSMAFTHILYYLSIQPDEVITVLREEVEASLNEHGWSKLAMGQLRRMDSFMKECVRSAGGHALSIDREVLKDFTFSDGTTIPAGSRVAIASFALHHDERYYEDPYEFKPFRFADMRAQEGESIKHQMITPNPEYMFFGAGRHAWWVSYQSVRQQCLKYRIFTSSPGRFFAVNELKTLIAHTLLTYDVKLEHDSKTVPKPFCFGRTMMPNRTAKVMFRKRSTYN